MLQERRVIRAGAEGVDAQIDRLADLTTALGRVRLGDLPQLGALPHREFGLGVDDVLRHVVHEALRSEEHTSELQSQSNLVCRLLLEKKKNDASSSHAAFCS